MKKEEKIINLLIENDLLRNTVGFMAKACNIDEKTLTMFINGNTPAKTDELMQKYVEKMQEILKDDEEKEDK